MRAWLLVLAAGILVLTGVGRPLQAQVSGKTIRAASCSNGDIQAALNASVANGTVLVPPGDCTLTNNIRLFNSLHLTLRGSGTGAGGTTLRTTSVATNALYSIYLGIDGRVTGFNFNCVGVRQDATTSTGWRVDHNIFTCDVSNHAVVSTPNSFYGSVKGVVDRNTFHNSGGIVYMSGAPTSGFAEAAGATVMSTPLGIGTDNAVYFETNAFDYSVTGAINVTDCQHAAMFVSRYNRIQDVVIETHNTYTIWGCRKWEVYENTWVFTRAVPGNAPFDGRAGTGVVYNNHVYGSAFTTGEIASLYGGVRMLTAYNPSTDSPLGPCNGTSPWDGNATSNGWPCYGQIGRATDSIPFPCAGVVGFGACASYPTQASDPAYIWNNVKHSTENPEAGEGTTTTLGATARLGTSDWVQSGRDFYINAGARPSYTAYTYPHPLTAASAWPPAPATGIVVR